MVQITRGVPYVGLILVHYDVYVLTILCYSTLFIVVHLSLLTVPNSRQVILFVMKHVHLCSCRLFLSFVFVQVIAPSDQVALFGTEQHIPDFDIDSLTRESQFDLTHSAP